MANVFCQDRDLPGRPFPRTAVEQAEIAAGDGVAGLFEQVDEVGADVAFMAGDKDFHRSKVYVRMRTALR